MAGANILVVEDDGIIAMHIQKCLRSMGYEVPELAMNGEEAIRKAASMRPDLVLMDIVLPDKMDGTQAAEIIRERYHIPVVYLTAYADEETLNKAKITAPYGYILKPFENRALQVAIEIALHKHQLEKQLNESERRFRETLENVRLAAITYDTSGKITFCNNYFLNLVDWPREAVVGQNLLERFAPLEPADRQVMADLLAHGRLPAHFEAEIVTRHGERRLIAWNNTPLFDNQGEVSGTASIGEDITERRRAEAEAQRRTSELEALARVSNDMRVAQTRAEIAPVVINQLLRLFDASAAALVRYDPESSAPRIEWGGGLWETQTGLDFSPAQLSSSHTHIFRVPLIARERTIGELWLGLNRPVNGQEERLLTAIADMTANAIIRQSLYDDLQNQLEALRKMQSMLMQSEKLAAIGQLVAGVAHELSNPLTSVILYAQLLQQRLSDEEGVHDLKKIVSEAQRVAKTVNGLLDFARQRPGQRQAVQINDIIHSSLDIISYELTYHNIAWEFNAGELPFTVADPHQLQQVLLNLLTNAWQAITSTRSKGTLKIDTEFALPRFPARQALESKVIRILVQDDGPGIPPELMTRIFDPFFTTKPEGVGNGLGLAICHGIIGEHGGHLWAESEPGQGARFIIELPVISPPLPEYTRVSPDAVNSNGRRGQLLIIDDEANVLEVLAKALRRKGYLVDAVNNGNQALDLLAREAYDLVLCDVHMPEMSGKELFERCAARSSEQSRRFIFITGDAIDANTRRFLNESRAFYLTKPFGLATLFEKVEQAIATTTVPAA